MPPAAKIRTTNPRLDAALACATLGWRVTPLVEREKRPWLTDWVAQASTDQGAIQAWWTERPQANVGVAFGVASKAVALDLDGPNACAILTSISGGDLPDTLEFTTKNGSRLIYSIPDGVKPRNVDFGEGKKKGSSKVQVLSTGKQSVMPPSEHPDGGLYAWVEGRGPGQIPIAPMPDWLIVETTRPEHADWADAQQVGPIDTFPPGADYNLRGCWEQLLTGCGFTACAGGRGGVRYYTRPGKGKGVSVSVGHYKARDGSPALHVFSSSIEGLRGDSTYDLFGTYARLKHGGSFSEAARALKALGYGGGTINRLPPLMKPSTNGKHHANDKASLNGDGQLQDIIRQPIPWESEPDDPELKKIAVASFPVETLPPLLGALVTQVSEATNSPPDYVATMSLGIAAGAIGASFVVDVKPGYRETSSLYFAVVAPKGSGKSPALSTLQAPLVSEQSRRRLNKIQEPVFVADCTVEKLAELLSKNSRGLLMIRDELAALLGGFNMYKGGGKGNDRQFFLQAHSGSPLSVMRKDPASDPVFVPHPCLSIVGGIQPGILAKFTSDADDGLYDRFCFCYPDPLPMAADNGATVRQEVLDAWGRVLDQIRDVQMVKCEASDSVRPYFLKLTDDAWDVWADWTAWLSSAVNGVEFSESMRGPAAKLRGAVPRLALVIRSLLIGYGEIPNKLVLDAECMTRDVKLAKYYLSHARRVWTDMGMDDRVSGVKTLIRWIKNRPTGTFTRRDAWRGLRATFGEIDKIGPPLKAAVNLGWIRYLDGSIDQPGRGQKTTVYEIHPAARSGAGDS